MLFKQLSHMLTRATLQGLPASEYYNSIVKQVCSPLVFGYQGVRASTCVCTQYGRERKLRSDSEFHVKYHDPQASSCVVISFVLVSCLVVYNKI